MPRWIWFRAWFCLAILVLFSANVTISKAEETNCYPAASADSDVSSCSHCNTPELGDALYVFNSETDSCDLVTECDGDGSTASLRPEHLDLYAAAMEDALKHSAIPQRLKRDRRFLWALTNYKWQQHAHSSAHKYDKILEYLYNDLCYNPTHEKRELILWDDKAVIASPELAGHTESGHLACLLPQGIVVDSRNGRPVANLSIAVSQLLCEQDPTETPLIFADCSSQMALNTKINSVMDQVYALRSQKAALEARTWACPPLDLQPTHFSLPEGFLQSAIQPVRVSYQKPAQQLICSADISVNFFGKLNSDAAGVPFVPFNDSDFQDAEKVVVNVPEVELVAEMNVEATCQKGGNPVICLAVVDSTPSAHANKAVNQNSVFKFTLQFELPEEDRSELWAVDEETNELKLRTSKLRCPLYPVEQANVTAISSSERNTVCSQVQQIEATAKYVLSPTRAVEFSQFSTELPVPENAHSIEWEIVSTAGVDPAARNSFQLDEDISIVAHDRAFPDADIYFVLLATHSVPTNLSEVYNQCSSLGTLHYDVQMRSECGAFVRRAAVVNEKERMVDTKPLQPPEITPIMMPTEIYLDPSGVNKTSRAIFADLLVNQKIIEAYSELRDYSRMEVAVVFDQANSVFPDELAVSPVADVCQTSNFIGTATIAFYAQDHCGQRSTYSTNVKVYNKPTLSTQTNTIVDSISLCTILPDRYVGILLSTRHLHAVGISLLNMVPPPNTIAAFLNAIPEVEQTQIMVSPRRQLGNRHVTVTKVVHVPTRCDPDKLVAVALKIVAGRTLLDESNTTWCTSYVQRGQKAMVPLVEAVQGRPGIANGALVKVVADPTTVQNIWNSHGVKPDSVVATAVKTAVTVVPRTSTASSTNSSPSSSLMYSAFVLCAITLIFNVL